jgi:hypothetical protein
VLWPGYITNPGSLHQLASLSDGSPLLPSHGARLAEFPLSV